MWPWRPGVLDSLLSASAPASEPAARLDDGPSSRPPPQSVHTAEIEPITAPLEAADPPLTPPLDITPDAPPRPAPPPGVYMRMHDLNIDRGAELTQQGQFDVVCFVAALSDYDHPPRRATGAASRLSESIALFASCCEQLAAVGSGARLLVVLSKPDLFARWITQPGRKLSAVWPEFVGDDAASAIAFVRSKFIDAARLHRPTEPPPRIVCADMLDHARIAGELWPALVDILAGEREVEGSAQPTEQDEAMAKGGGKRHGAQTGALRRSRSWSSNGIFDAVRARMGRLSMSMSMNPRP
jgi:hypothetical protein